MKDWVAIVVAVILVLGAGYCVKTWCDHHRYSVVPVSNGGAYRVDRQTGFIWWLAGDKASLMENAN